MTRRRWTAASGLHAGVLLGLVAAAALTGCAPADPPAPRATVAAERGTVELSHVVEVPPAGDCPGYRVLSPVPVEVVAGTQSVVVPLAAGDADTGEPSASVLLTCLGRTGTSVAQLVADRERLPADELGALEPAVVVTGPFGDALRITTDMGLTHLTEWYVDGDGWAFGVGHLREDGDDGHLATVEAMLATWEWS